MPSIYDLKPGFQSLLKPLVKALHAHGVTANQVTLAAVALSFMGGGMIAWKPDEAWPLLVLPLVLLVRMGLNAIDGMLARDFAQQSKLGAMLNELGDVISDAALYLPLAWLPMVYPPLVVGIVILSILSEMTGVVAVQIGARRQYQGPMGKSDRAFWLGAMAFALGVGAAPGNWINWLFGVMLVMLLITITNRVRTALKETHAA